MTITTIALIGLFIILVLLVVFQIKNQRTYHIQMMWIGEKYQRKDWGNVHLPEYEHLLFNLKVWKYIPLDEYNEKYK